MKKVDYSGEKEFFDLKKTMEHFSPLGNKSWWVS
jgi:hypothetical protein